MEDSREVIVDHSTLVKTLPLHVAYLSLVLIDLNIPLPGVVCQGLIITPECLQ